jgi:hypothetical protein
VDYLCRYKGYFGFLTATLVPGRGTILLSQYFLQPWLVLSIIIYDVFRNVTVVVVAVVMVMTMGLAREGV